MDLHQRYRKRKFKKWRNIQNKIRLPPITKVKKDSDREKRYDQITDRNIKRKIGHPLEIGENVLVPAERLNIKDPSGWFFKITTENKPLFKKDQTTNENK